MARLIGHINDKIAQDFLPVLTGAGASAALGFPMMNRAVDLLTQYLRELPDSGPADMSASRRGRLKHYKNWIDEEVRNLNIDSDLETFLIALDAHISYLKRGQVHGLADRILGNLEDRPPIGNDSLSPLDALLDMRFAYMEFVHHEYGERLSDEARNSARRSFQALAEALHPKPYSLFTTNYDTVAEAVPEMLGKRRLDGFAVSTPEAPETWTPRGFDNYTSPDDQMPVFHLHGAASWVVVGKEVRRYPGLGRLREVGESLLVYPGEPAKDQLTSNEMPDPSRLASDYFAQAIATQRRLIAIGYSFRDVGIIRQIDRAAAYAQRSIRVHVIAPDRSAAVDKLFEEGSVRGNFIKARFEEPQRWAPAVAEEINAPT
jgi:hypothetical protein